MDTKLFYNKKYRNHYHILNYESILSLYLLHYEQMNNIHLSLKQKNKKINKYYHIHNPLPFQDKMCKTFFYIYQPNIMTQLYYETLYINLSSGNLIHFLLFLYINTYRMNKRHPIFYDPLEKK